MKQKILDLWRNDRGGFWVFAAAMGIVFIGLIELVAKLL